MCVCVQMIAYNLCYSTCVGKVSHARAAAAASAQRAAESTPVGVTGHMSGAPVQGVRLGVTSYMPPADWMVPGAACDPESLVSSCDTHTHTHTRIVVS